MATQLFKEILNGPYNGVSPPTVLPGGSISDGENVRRASRFGGWKPRKGAKLHNVAAIAAAPVLSLHQFTNPIQKDYHFIAQCDGKLWEATNNPPEEGATFGTELANLVSTERPGFSTTVNDYWVYADGDGAPVIWGGDFPSCFGFLATIGTDSTDMTKEVTDNDPSTFAIIPTAFATSSFYVCASEIASAIRLQFISGQTNSEAATLTVKAWRSGSWVAVTGLSDGTVTAGATLAKDGTISWTEGADELRVLGGMAGFWYQFTWSANLSAGIRVWSSCVSFPPTLLTNKWNGVYESPLGVRYYQAATGQYEDYAGKVLINTQAVYMDLASGATTDFIYVKTAEPVRGLGFAIVDETGNTALAVVDSIEVWTGAAWESVSGIIDETLDTAGTSSFHQTGTIWFDPGALIPRRKLMPFDSLPSFWYRLSWDVALSADPIRIYLMTAVVNPEPLGIYDGCIEFKGRLFLWGDRRFPNRLRYSSVIRPDGFSGSDSGYTAPFGDSQSILCCVRFYNELMVIKERSIWLLEGYSPETFGILKLADTIGACSPHAAAVVEAGSPAMKGDETLTVVGIVSHDGLYLIDGRKPRKVGDAVEHFFNVEYSDCIEAEKLKDLQLFVDSTNNEFHIQLPRSATQAAVELIYNHVTHEWYPPWRRRAGGTTDYLVCGTELIDTEGRFRTYGGNSSGRVFRLEDGTADSDNAGGDVIIRHSIKTRAIAFDQKMPTTLSFTFLKVILEARQQKISGVIQTNFYRNLSVAKFVLDNPHPIELKKAGFSLVTDGLTTNQTDCACFQLEFICETLDLEMELWSFLYSIDLKGEIIV